MNKDEILMKAQNGEGLTVEEIKVYQNIVKPVKHVYGKYGTLAKIYLQEHNVGKYWALGGDLPDYLHGIDRQAEELYSVMYDKLSKDEKYKRTGNYLEDVRRIKEMQDRIDLKRNRLRIRSIATMERKEDSSRRITRRKYEEKHKERRKQTSGNFGTMIPRALYDEINEFLRVNNITKVRLIVEGYEALKRELSNTTQNK